MLDSMRKRKDNLVYSILILATAAVMTLYGVGKMQQGDQSGGAAAWVNGEVITRREFQQDLEYKTMQYQQMLGGQYDEKFLAALQIPQRTLEELIQFKLLGQQAKKLEITIPDNELADHIRSLPYYQKDGKFDAEGYSKIPNRGLEEKRQRERLRVVKFQNYLMDRVRLTPDQLRVAYDLKETKADLDYAKIDFAKLATGHKPTTKEIEAASAPGNQPELQQYFDAHKRDFTDKASVNLLQIRAGVPFQAKPEAKAAARKKIEAIAKSVTPQTFAEVAKKRSDDEFAKKGGSHGWVAQGTLEKPMEDAVAKLQPNQVSPIVETPFGFYLLLITDKRPEVVHQMTEVKSKIAEKVAAEKFAKTFADDKRKEWDAALAKGESIEADLKKYSVEVKKTGPFSVGSGYIPNVGQADPILDAVFELTKEHPLPKKLYYFQDAYYFVKLRSIEPAKEADFLKKENQESLEKSVSTALQTELITQYVASIQKTANIKTELNFDARGAGADGAGAGNGGSPVEED